MKRSLAVLALALGASPLLVHADAQSLRTIRELEQTQERAAIARDRAVLERLFAADFRMVNPSGGVADRAQLFDVLLGGPPAYSSAVYETQHFRDFGDTVITIGLETVVMAGGPQAGQTVKRRITQVWRRDEIHLAAQAAPRHARAIVPSPVPARPRRFARGGRLPLRRRRGAARPIMAFRDIAARKEIRMTRQDTAVLLNELIETSHDGEKGFAKAAKEVLEPELKSLFVEGAMRCREGARELEHEVRQMGLRAGPGRQRRRGDPPRVARGEIPVLVAGHPRHPRGMRTGRGLCEARYAQVLEEEDLPGDLRTMIERQFAGVRRNHDRVRALRDALPRRA